MTPDELRAHAQAMQAQSEQLAQCAQILTLAAHLVQQGQALSDVVLHVGGVLLRVQRIAKEKSLEKNRTLPLTL